MSQRFARLCTIGIALLLSLGTAPSSAGSEQALKPRHANPPAEDPNQARVIVWYRPQGSLMHALSAQPGAKRRAQHAAALSQRLGLALTDGRSIGDRAQVVTAKGISSSQLAARLAADGEVEVAAPDFRRYAFAAPNDPLYADAQPSATPTAGQWYLRAPNSTTVSAINAAGAWNITTGTSSVVVAVLDTGVRFDHPDLAGKLYSGYDFIESPGTANEASGRDADASDPGDWVTSTEANDPSSGFYQCPAEDSSWHGTQVAGLLGAGTHNGVGMASVGHNIMVLPVRVLGKCGGFDSDIQAGMLWAAGLTSNPVVNPHPVRVINMSLGSQGSCPASYPPVISQLTAAGVAIVASAGNDEGIAVAAPANCAGMIAVAGLRHNGAKVGFSSVGPEVALSAPAGNSVNDTSTGAPSLYPLLTTTNSGLTTPASHTYTDSFNTSMGTSFSAPLVSGALALMLSANPSLTLSQLRNALLSSTRSFPTTGPDPSVQVCHAPNGVIQEECYCTSTTCGSGMLDVAAAVSAVALTSKPTVPFNASAANVAVGTPVTFDGAAARDSTGGTNLTYQWTLSSGGTIAHFTSATNAAGASMVFTEAGTAVVTLTATDVVGGAQKSASVSVTVAGAVSTPPIILESSSGGGALGIAWLLALCVAIGAVARSRR